MKQQIIVGIIILILIIAGVYFFTAYSSGEEQYESDVEFGAWGQEVLLEYEDGTTSSMTPVSTLSTFKHDGKEVVALQYHLNAKATGTTYGTIRLHFTTYTISFRLEEKSTKIISLKDYIPSQTIDFDVDSEWHEMVNVRFSIYDLVPEYTTAGTYTLTCTPDGDINYWYPDNEITKATLPCVVEATLTVEEDYNPPVEIIVASHPGGGDIALQKQIKQNYGYGQSFIPDATTKLTKIRTRMIISAPVPDNTKIYCYVHTVRSNSGIDFPKDEIASMYQLAGDIKGTGTQTIDWFFDGAVTLDAGVKYSYVFFAPDYTDVYIRLIAVDDLYPDGNLVFKVNPVDSSCGAYNQYDSKFEVWGVTV